MKKQKNRGEIMGLFDKVKNLFTEEIEEEVQPVRRETRHFENEVPKKVPDPVEVKSVNVEAPKVEEEKPTREERFVFFSDDDFKDLEKPKKEEKKVEVPKKVEPKPLAYRGAVPQTKPEPKKEFKPSPIISPVYGVLDKNYKKEEIKIKRSPRVYKSSITIDDVRNKAYGTLEDDIKDDLLGKTLLQEEEPVQSEIDIFEELDKYDDDNIEPEEKITRSTSDVDEIFDKLDDKKEEILDELDNKKVEILDEIDTKKNSFDLLTEDVMDNISSEEELDENEEINQEETTLEDDTETLAQELELQKQKLEEINSMMNENKKTTKTKKKEEPIEDDLDESELFDLIDSMYEKKDDE
jgi:hypothetical protein